MVPQRLPDHFQVAKGTVPWKHNPRYSTVLQLSPYQPWPAWRFPAVDVGCKLIHERFDSGLRC